jgi:hypothetical protein
MCILNPLISHFRWKRFIDVFKIKMSSIIYRRKRDEKRIIF